MSDKVHKNWPPMPFPLPPPPQPPPFRPPPTTVEMRGVRYIQTPRCDSCRFWMRNEPVPPNTIGPDTTAGTCRLFSDDSTFDGTMPQMTPTAGARLAWTGPFTGADGATFDTDESFGCVQWEDKP